MERGARSPEPKREDNPKSEFPLPLARKLESKKAKIRNQLEVIGKAKSRNQKSLISSIFSFSHLLSTFCFQLYIVRFHFPLALSPKLVLLAPALTPEVRVEVRGRNQQIRNPQSKSAIVLL
jgi:hypothetical protein